MLILLEVVLQAQCSLSITDSYELALHRLQSLVILPRCAHRICAPIALPSSLLP